MQHAAGDLIEILFGKAHLIPQQRNAMVMTGGISWNYTTWLTLPSWLRRRCW